MIKDMIYVDPVLWIFYGVILGGLLFGSIFAIITMVKQEKWIELGRELEREDKGSKFKKTKGARRLRFHCALGCGTFASQEALDRHIAKHDGLPQVPTVFAPKSVVKPKVSIKGSKKK